jgi:hypothetical protein
MTSRMARIVGSAFVAIALLACGGSQASPSHSIAAATSTTKSVAPSSAAPGSGHGALCAKAFVPCPLPAGTYSSAPFEHPFTFTISGEDWTNDRAWPHGGSTTRSGTNAFLWASGVESGVIAGATSPIGPTPADFIAHLRKFDGFTVGDPIPITVDGISGSYVDVLTNDMVAEKVYLIPEDAFNLSAGERLRFIVLDIDGAAVILIVDSFKAADFDAFMAEVAQPILDGLAWD